MTYSYFPGCTLKDRARELDRCARLSARALGIELEELPAWQCCGAVYPQVSDEIASRLASVRALADARDGVLVTMCSACHHVLKRTAWDLQNDGDFRTKVNNYIQPEEPITGDVRVVHFLELIRDGIGFEELKKKVVHPLTGRKIGAFYGCMVLRPSKVLAFDDPENPKIIEDFIRALGAESVKYPYRNECCGAYVSLTDRAAAQAQADKAILSAAEHGAGELVTACPLCRYNLVENAVKGQLPVAYFTELLAEALGVKEEAL